MTNLEKFTKSTIGIIDDFLLSPDFAERKNQGKIECLGAEVSFFVKKILLLREFLPEDENILKNNTCLDRQGEEIVGLSEIEMELDFDPNFLAIDYRRSFQETHPSWIVIPFINICSAMHGAILKINFLIFNPEENIFLDNNLQKYYPLFIQMSDREQLKKELLNCFITFSDFEENIFQTKIWKKILRGTFMYYKYIKGTCDRSKEVVHEQIDWHKICRIFNVEKYIKEDVLNAFLVEESGIKPDNFNHYLSLGVSGVCLGKHNVILQTNGNFFENQEVLMGINIILKSDIDLMDEIASNIRKVFNCRH